MGALHDAFKHALEAKRCFCERCGSEIKHPEFHGLWSCDTCQRWITEVRTEPAITLGIGVRSP